VDNIHPTHIRSNNSERYPAMSTICSHTRGRDGGVGGNPRDEESNGIARDGQDGTRGSSGWKGMSTQETGQYTQILVGRGRRQLDTTAV
jgi:hypothetical protein